MKHTMAYTQQDLINIERYYQRRQEYPAKMRRLREERRKAAERRALVLFFAPIIVRILMIVIGLAISVGIIGWADRVVFDYDIEYTLVSCFIIAPSCCGAAIMVGEWVIDRIKAFLSSCRF